MPDVTSSQNMPADLWASWKTLWQRAGNGNIGFGESQGNALAWQEGWQHLTEANMRLLQGMVALSQHQVSLAQQLIAEDYGDLTRLRDGGALMPLPAQQIDLARKRFHRNLLAMRQVTDEMSQCLFDAAQTALGGWAAEVAADLPRSEPIRGVGARAPAAKAAA
jgi:hypothetical protein